ncbi:MinD/ParA family protein [Desulfonatronospira sp.]|uniref:MinD/ParA family protein n=1 Tax=Desulfonatronospira sp. TaxID=1962951 RepID=UPI0025BBF036|nr:MinD/ParA family protein [Desulfonatronospira sp.]
MEHKNRTLSLSIVSGKGGVGKTNLSLNIAYALFNAAQNTLIVDCDLGLANLDVMLDISPDKTLNEILDDDALAHDIIYKLENSGLGLIPAASGVSDLLDLDEDQQMQIIQRLESLLQKYHFLILDVGAGISRTVRTFSQMTHKRVVVITPEPTSLTDGYALIKVLYTRQKVKDFYILVNMVESEKEARRGFERIRAACSKFLNLEVNYLGHVRNDPIVLDAVRKQRPVMQFAPRSTASRDIMQVADTLIQMRAEARQYIADTPPLQMGEPVT